MVDWCISDLIFDCYVSLNFTKIHVLYVIFDF